MHSYKVLLLVLFLAAIADSQELQPTIDAGAHWALAEWLSVDKRFPTTVTRKALASDAIGKRFRIEFETDDGVRANGLLAMPGDDFATARLAVALHPMGADQALWHRHGKPIFGGEISAHLRTQGYAVLTLDARWHGERKTDGIGPREIIGFAHGDNPTPYNRVIADTVRDYRLAMAWAQEQADLDTSAVLALGYSMGAQMSLLLAATETRISSVLAMVPPYVDQPLSPVAPRNHVGRITQASVLMIAGRDDPYSTLEQSQQVFQAIGSPDKDLVVLDGEHVLPEAYVATALAFIDEQTTENRP